MEIILVLQVPISLLNHLPLSLEINLSSPNITCKGMLPNKIKILGFYEASSFRK